MSGDVKDGAVRVEAVTPDPEIGRALAALDPTTMDPNYWLRFRAWVVDNAAPELARRRLAAELTVGDVMTSWARMVMPTAILAAALAGLMLLRGESVSTQPLGVEEMLVAEVDGQTIPAALDAPSAVAFASEIF
jgi:hypothetical protein